MAVQAMFDEVADRLVATHRDVHPGRMFASEGLKTGDKFFAMVNKGALVLKLPSERVEEPSASGDAGPFEVGGRRMREWLRIAPEDAAACESLMSEAREFVRG
jgi:TfoX/Sxy family transcriptional regulator of competence genes